MVYDSLFTTAKVDGTTPIVKEGSHTVKMILQYKHLSK